MKAHRSALPQLRRSALWAALSLTFAASAQALTLGSPQVQSKLGEPLRAEIAVTQISAEEEQGIQAELADADLYRSLQMELPSNGNRPLDIHVQLLKRESGNYVLRLSSQHAVTRRDMDLLLRMRWATGQLLRNVTLSMNDGAGAKASPTITPLAPSPAVAPAASPAAVAAASSLPVPKPSAPATVAATPAPAKVDNKERKAQSKSSSEGKIEVQRGDTASEIVAKQMPGNCSILLIKALTSGE